MDILENKVICIDVENRPGHPQYEQLGHNTIINDDLEELKGVSTIVRSFPMNSPTRRRDLTQKYAVSYMKLTMAQYFTTTIRKHHRCVEIAMNNDDLLKAMHHIDQCIKLAPNNARFHIERAEIYTKLQDYQHAINDLHIALSLRSKSSEVNVVDQHEVVNTDSKSSADASSPSSSPSVSPSLTSTNMSRIEYQEAILKTGQLHIVYGKYLYQTGKYDEALKQYETGRGFVDQYAQMNDSIIGDSVTPGILVTLMDVLKVYESMRRDNDSIDLLEKCVNYLEKGNIVISEEILKENTIQTTRLYLPQISDLLYTKAKILFKQSGQSITQAYHDLKRAIHHCPSHENSLNLLKQLESLSSCKQEEAVGSMLRNHFIDALQSINMAIYAQPESASLYFDKGAILRKLNRLDESVDCILQGIELLDSISNDDQNRSSDDYQSLYLSGKNQLFLTLNCYAIRLLTDGKYHESNELICQLLKVDPSNYRLLILFGDCQYQMNRHEEALKMYEKAKLIVNKLLNASNQCTCTNNTVVDIPESVKSINHRICLACYYLSKQRIKENDWPAALNHLNYCIQLAPFKSEFYMTRALVHYQLCSAKQSWEDVLIYIYLNLSDWALCHQTNGKWSTYPVWYQSMIHNRVISHVNEQIGPLIHRLTPKYIDLIKVAQSKGSEMFFMKSLRNVIAVKKCKTCKNDNNNDENNNNDNKTTTVDRGDNPIKFENQIDWLKNNILFDLFSEPTDKDISSPWKSDAKKCEDVKYELQSQKSSNIIADYKQIKAGIQSIRSRKHFK